MSDREAGTLAWSFDDPREIRGGGVSTDVTVEPEAPTSDIAHERTKRMARVESGHVVVSHKGDPVEVGDA